MRPPLTLLQGTVDILILKSLSFGRQHGYGISRWIRERSEGALGLEDAALYQALHRLERRGVVLASWGLSENNRKAKYYELTQLGRKQLRSKTDVWTHYASAVFKVLQTA